MEVTEVVQEEVCLICCLVVAVIPALGTHMEVDFR